MAHIALAFHLADSFWFLFAPVGRAGEWTINRQRGNGHVDRP